MAVMSRLLTPARQAHTPEYTPPARRSLHAIAGKANWGLFDNHGRRIATISNKIANQEAYAVALASMPDLLAALDSILGGVNTNVLVQHIGRAKLDAARAALARAKGE